MKSAAICIFAAGASFALQDIKSIHLGALETQKHLQKQAIGVTSHSVLAEKGNSKKVDLLKQKVEMLKNKVRKLDHVESETKEII